jgi:hypothetical protein
MKQFTTVYSYSTIERNIGLHRHHQGIGWMDNSNTKNFTDYEIHTVGIFFAIILICRGDSKGAQGPPKPVPY